MYVFFKITGILLLLIASFLIGYLKSLSFKKRLLELKKILAGTLRLKEYISNCPAEIESIYKSCYGQCNDIQLENGKIYAKESSIYKEDCALLNEFFISLGSIDLNSECARINLYSELIKKQILSAEAEVEENSKIWQTCSICIGIGIAILII